jgi:hypothetical protein
MKVLGLIGKKTGTAKTLANSVLSESGSRKTHQVLAIFSRQTAYVSTEHITEATHLIFNCITLIPWVIQTYIFINPLTLMINLI